MNNQELVQTEASRKPSGITMIVRSGAGSDIDIRTWYIGSPLIMGTKVRMHLIATVK